MLENSVFRGLVKLPQASTTIRKWTMGGYKAKKEALKEELSLSISRVHISFDI